MIAVSTGSLHGAFHKLEQEGSLVEMTSQTKLWALSAGALALSLALAGCGSSGGGSAAVATTPPPSTTDPTTPTTSGPMVSLAGLAGAMATAGEYAIAAGETMDAGDVTFACPAGGADCTVTVDADGAATSAGGMATAARSAAYIAAATAAAETKETAISTEAAVAADDDGPGGADATTDHTIAIARDGDGTTVTITVVDDGAADDAPEFEQRKDFEDGRTVHVLANEADVDGNVVEEIMIVYTDIDAPTATAFAMVDGQTLDARDLDEDVNADDEGSATDDWTALAVDENSADVRALVMSSAFAANTAAELTFDSDDTNTDDMDEAFEVAGTYNNAPGTYRCDGGADCTVMLDGDGMITAMSDGWVFTPDEGATSDVADADYLHYGFWLKRTTDEDGLTYNEVETFADSSIDASDNVSSVEGTATYDGGAVGVYVMKHAYDPGTGDLADATSGHFKADASLTANFGGGSIPADDHNTITGTIDKFVLQHEEENEWSVALGGDITASDGTASGTAKGDVMGEDGSFSATFHGPVASIDHDDDIDTPNIIPQPHTVVGEFNSVFDNGSVAGAFGARKQ